MKRNASLSLFLLLCFTLPLVSIAVQHAFHSTNGGTWALLLTGFAAMTPTVAAIVVVKLSGQVGALRDFFRRCYCIRFKVSLVFLALAIPVLEILIMQMLLRLAGDQPLPLQAITTKRLLMVAFALVSEELGWRGFMQAELSKRIPVHFIPLCTGIIWALWHYHFYLSGSMTYPLLWLFIGCIADSTIYFWMTRKANGNILPASLLHFSYNLVSALFFSNDTVSTVAYPLFVLASILIAVCFASIGEKQRGSCRH